MQPVRGHVRVCPEADDPLDPLEPDDPLAPLLELPLVAWHDDAVHPVAGQVSVPPLPDAVPVLAKALPPVTPLTPASVAVTATVP